METTRPENQQEREIARTIRSVQQAEIMQMRGGRIAYSAYMTLKHPAQKPAPFSELPVDEQVAWGHAANRVIYDAAPRIMSYLMRELVEAADRASEKTEPNDSIGRVVWKRTSRWLQSRRLRIDQYIRDHERINSNGSHESTVPPGDTSGEHL